jgi:hypothetical protein
MIPKTDWFRIAIYNDRLQETTQKLISKGCAYISAYFGRMWLMTFVQRSCVR